MTDPVFTKGQKVVAQHVEDYGSHLTKGKEYAVDEYTPPEVSPFFTWPAYVSVIGDMNIRVTCHAYRFKPKEEENER